MIGNRLVFDIITLKSAIDDGPAISGLHFDAGAADIAFKATVPG